MDVFLIIAVVALGLTLWMTGVLTMGLNKMGRLKMTAPQADGDFPRVSVVVPACNEEKTIRRGLASLLMQDYPDLEIIVIDDRSTDKTFEIVSVLQESDSRLHVYRVTDLPVGWLGKCHALQYGAERATGVYLLFTDADIYMEKTTVARAVAHVLANQIDHLSLFFRNSAAGWLLNAMILDGGANLLLLFKPWKVHDPDSRFFVGIGAFNMVKNSVYKMIDGHSSIRMHPIDDIMLGKIIKKNGFSQQCLLALEFVTVNWYESVSQMVNGVMKNLFSLFHYRLTGVVMAVFMSVLVNVIPLWGALFSSGPARILFMLTVSLRLISFTYAATVFKVSPWCIPGSLVSPYFNVFALIRATWVTVRDKGIVWRDTFYSLSELKKSEPILSKLYKSTDS